MNGFADIEAVKEFSQSMNEDYVDGKSDKLSVRMEFTLLFSDYTLPCIALMIVVILSVTPVGSYLIEPNQKVYRYEPVCLSMF